MDKLFHPTIYDVCDYATMLGLKFVHASKMGHSHEIIENPSVIKTFYVFFILRDGDT